MNDQLNETLLGWINALNGPLWDFWLCFWSQSVFSIL